MFFVLLKIAIVDMKEKRIPNKLLVILLGIVGAFCVLVPYINIWERAAGMCSVSVILLLIILIRPYSFGMGDIKLMAISGLLLGVHGNLQAFALAIFLAAGFCLVGLIRKKITLQTAIPLGPFLCIGIFLVNVLVNL